MHIRKKSCTFAGNLLRTMQYSVLHLTYSFAEDWQQELFEQDLCDLGFEVFDGTSAYIQTDVWEDNRRAIEELIANTEGAAIVSVEACPDANWNAQWEAEHEIEDLPLGVRIVPHCAFGAGHHETTSMMIDALLEAKDTGLFNEPKSVLDMGCGTGVLGIMAKKCGAEHVVAVDIDDKSVANTHENALANHTTLDIRLGSTPPDGAFDLILANIHRNILVEQMPVYAKILNVGGQLWLSGFYAEDIPYLSQAAEAVGLQHTETRHTNEWQWIRLKK